MKLTASRVCMIVCSHYPEDPRVRREAEALIESGVQVDVVCLRRHGRSASEELRGVGVYRVPLNRKRAGKVRYIWDYCAFMVLAFAYVTVLHARRRYQVVHIHNMPDVLVLTALVPRLLGARMILDLHDPTPEVYQTKFGIDPEGAVFRCLVRLEQWSIALASRVLTPNEAFRELFVSRGCPENKIQIVMNSPQESVFRSGGNLQAMPTTETKRDGFAIMFHGGVYERHGLDLALTAIARLRRRIPGLRFHVYGSGDYVETFRCLVNDFGLEDIVRYHGGVDQEIIADAIPEIDLGLIPNQRTPFTEINFPTRIFEYLHYCKPVIVPNTRGIEDYFDNDAMFYFDPDRPESLEEQIWQVYCDPQRTAEAVARGQSVYEQHTWAIEKDKFMNGIWPLLTKCDKKTHRATQAETRQGIHG